MLRSWYLRPPSSCIAEKALLCHSGKDTRSAFCPRVRQNSNPGRRPHSGAHALHHPQHKAAWDTWRRLAVLLGYESGVSWKGTLGMMTSKSFYGKETSCRVQGDWFNLSHKSQIWNQVSGSLSWSCFLQCHPWVWVPLEQSPIDFVGYLSLWDYITYRPNGPPLRVKAGSVDSLALSTGGSRGGPGHLSI